MHNNVNIATRGCCIKSEQKTLAECCVWTALMSWRAAKHLEACRLFNTVSRCFYIAKTVFSEVAPL